MYQVDPGESNSIFDAADSRIQVSVQDSTLSSFVRIKAAGKTETNFLAC